jgi:hypothetical protein
MLSLYNILVDNRSRIVTGVIGKIPREVRAYSRVPRGELRESVEHLFDAYLDMVASGKDEKLRHMFGYIARVRVAQAFRLSSILRALLIFNVVVRPILQEIYRYSGSGEAEARKGFNEALATIEVTTFDALATFSDVFQDYVQSRVDEHNQYLQQKNRQHGIDLSKFVLFRA